MVKALSDLEEDSDIKLKKYLCAVRTVYIMIYHVLIKIFNSKVVRISVILASNITAISIHLRKFSL